VGALDEEGRPSFNLLQGFGSTQAIVFYALDLLMLRGKEVRLLEIAHRSHRPYHKADPYALSRRSDWWRVSSQRRINAHRNEMLKKASNS
jgi:hypothetical protein